jgi:hypothetical protein
VKVLLGWHLPSRELPASKRYDQEEYVNVLFVEINDERQRMHHGEFRREGGRDFFRSDATDVANERLEFTPAEVWCWAYEPEVPT